jgi:hypothetical protein
MRKEADYKVDARVIMVYNTNNDYFKKLIQQFEDFLKKEVLLKQIEFKQDLDESSE